MMGNQSLCDNNMVEEEEAEYVLLDLDGISSEVHIPPNAPYVLSGLDTLNPILTIDGKIKLIGQYDETIGTCLVFSESDAPSMVHKDTGPSESNHLPGRRILDPKETESKQVKPVTQLHKILKFRLLHDTETEDARKKPKED
ncbi:PREDICTED: uncharacterized protein LOC109228949 [Nicotiana attenuata]|uniref:Transcription factor TFIIIC triple barrel domain-containing protein n=1 Tax=Nicotiana attenuata TaxID=49451 RepID=A0A1J6INM0_NICAT|nr:PREDICTED: uncharacterized protein LOC109228949 [Nicotiana attenuata]XP_019249769.1 PREDICTED: uncharacterized protein LOC109228949 [Nicotiana attenuata]XP_019249770.1 PREDICTED: uncharacterized protein LOC109228949 [Nicotiana attenuata]XP_019249771.1 PREDICTED: uncharacterized protein LOC109228949 [Nicotiana attenuata]XP_019249772.1 PREDICTED: uncharacterized protein LOC109228949 [Nicotiana attenuata]OIT00435.1 hypothetical protein A4A49_21315 [Nicotiana attenuata]